MNHSLSVEYRRRQPFKSGHWLVGSDSVRAIQSSGRTVSQDESCPTPNQYPASRQRYMEEKKNTEKKRKTQKQERFLLVRKANKLLSLQTDGVIRMGQ